MKKLILLITILISTISINAKTYEYISNGFAVDFLDGYGYGKWIPAEIGVDINILGGSIVIYSSEIQKFKVIDYKLYSFKTYHKIEMSTEDSNLLSCAIELFEYHNGYTYIKIIYNNVMYKYRLKLHKTIL